MAQEPRIAFPEPAGGGDLAWRGAGLALVGRSVAALATAFALPDLGVAVDMGACSALLAAQDTVLLTHCHADHVAGLVAWLSAHTRRHPGRPTRIVVPAERRDALLAALAAWPELDGVRRRCDLEAALVAVRAGDRVDLPGGWAEAFAVRHGVPALGWRLGRAGERRALLAFGGDGTVEPYRENPGLLDAGLALVECTFLAPGQRAAARWSGHAHLLDWLELAPDLPCDRLALVHLPAGTKPADLRRALDGWPAGAPPVLAWLSPPDAGGCAAAAAGAPVGRAGGGEMEAPAREDPGGGGLRGRDPFHR